LVHAFSSASAVLYAALRAFSRSESAQHRIGFGLAVALPVLANPREKPTATFAMRWDMLHAVRS
jgi:hypothetical protein